VMKWVSHRNKYMCVKRSLAQRSVAHTALRWAKNSNNLRNYG